MLPLMRDAQIEIFREAKLEAFVTRAATKLKTRYAAQCDAIGEEALRHFVRDGIERAKRYNVTKEGTVSVLIELFLAFGERLECTPDAAWANRILNHPTLPDQLKVGMLEERLFGATGGRTVVMSSSARDDLDVDTGSTT